MYYYNHLEDYIKSLYQKMNINSPIELQLSEIAKKLGIKIFYWNDKSQALFLKNRAFIFLHNDLSPEEEWQDFIHELAHILLHSGNQMQMPTLFRNYQESKARNFAYHACVPTFMLQKMELPKNMHEAARLLQKTFNVEYDFALVRLTQYINKQNFIPVWNNI